MARVSKIGLVVLLASGCVTFDPVGADPDPPAPTDGGGGGTDANVAARRAFTQDVHPILNAKCGACHSAGGLSTPWFRPDPNEAYTALTTLYSDILGKPMFSQDAPIITAPEQTGQSFYSPDQIDRIFYWFSLETL